MFDQQCSMCLGLRETEFVTPDGELKTDTCPYCVDDYAYAALYAAMNAKQAMRLAIAAAVLSLEKSASYVRRGAE